MSIQNIFDVAWSEWSRRDNTPFSSKKLSIKKMRKRIKKANGICEVGDVLDIFLKQFTPLELRWIHRHIDCNDKEWNIGIR